MREGSDEAPALPAVRVVSTPVPARRLFGGLAEQLRSVFDDTLDEPLPRHLLDVLAPPGCRVASESRPTALARE